MVVVYCGVSPLHPYIKKKKRPQMRVAFVVTTHHDNYVVASTTMTHLLAVVECLPLEPPHFICF